jgi:hypothetical protein
MLLLSEMGVDGRVVAAASTPHAFSFESKQRDRVRVPLWIHGCSRQHERFGGKLLARLIYAQVFRQRQQ